MFSRKPVTVDSILSNFYKTLDALEQLVKDKLDERDSARKQIESLTSVVDNANSEIDKALAVSKKIEDLVSPN